LAMKQIPRQPDFSIKREDLGKITLEDGTTIETRFVLADLVVTGEDILGPQIVLGHVMAVRVRSPPELIEEFKNKPLVPDISLPLTTEAGWKTIKIAGTIATTQSAYLFENYVLSIEVHIESAARNDRYRAPNGSPPYNIRWTMKYSVSKA
jgi:hypothetical protein